MLLCSASSSQAFGENCQPPLLLAWLWLSAALLAFSLLPLREHALEPHELLFAVLLVSPFHHCQTTPTPSHQVSRLALMCEAWSQVSRPSQQLCHHLLLCHLCLYLYLCHPHHRPPLHLHRDHHT